MTAKQVSEFKETEIGKIPVDWEVKKLGDVFELSQGLQISSKKRISENKEGYLPLLKIRDLLTNKFSEFVSLDDVPLVYIASKEDIIYTRTGQVGLVYTNVEGCVHNNCFKIHYGDFDKMFVYYTLNQRRVFEYANAVAGGSVQKDLTHPAFKSCLITYPKNKQEQIRISTFISNLDSKIQNLQNQNKILEQTAQAIFQSWFVDFDGVTEWNDSELGKIPKGWSVKQISDVANIFSGGTPSTSKKEYWNGNVPWLSSGETRNPYIIDTERKITNLGIENSSTRLAKILDVVVASAGQGNTRGQTSLCLIDTYINQSVVVLRSKRESVYSHYLFYHLRSNYDKLRDLSDSHSSRGSLPKNVLFTIPLIVPDDDVLQKFNKISKKISQEIKINFSKILMLTQIRDALLPKLMSGEIRV